MSSDDELHRSSNDLGLWIGAILAFLLVIVGLVNTIPGIPGLDDLVKEIAGTPNAQIRKFPFEYFYPAMFVVMMLIVALRHSMWRDWYGKSPLARAFGLFMDIALVLAGIAVAMTFWTEIESVCLIDQITGERAELIAKSLKEEQDFARDFGLPIPDSIDDPKCLNTTGVWIFAIIGFSVAIFLAYNVKVWGLPLVMVAILVAAYTMITVAVWYFYGAEDINKYLITKLGGEPRQLIDGRPRMHDILTNNAAGILGRFMNVILNTVFPYIILGALFGVSAGGQSLIKIAFRWTRHLRGGPAHAAIVSSAMFGTISGGPVVNVLSTGVLTIPMMLRSGFSRVFAGGVEAAASNGGSIMPPVMGVAAFILAALTAVPYSQVIIAALIPAIAYFGCLFLSAMFQSRKQGIKAIGRLTEDMHLTNADRLNLVMIFAPILLILFLLLTPKEAVGCGPVGWLLGIETAYQDGACRAVNLPWLMLLLQNSAGDAGSAGWWAVMLLMVLLFLDRDMRARPQRLVQALADAGILVSTLYLMFLAVSIIDFCLSFTGLSSFIAIDVLGWLQSLDLGGAGTGLFQFLALFTTMALAILLGMGMPAVPAYINVALLMGPVLTGLGISLFTAHMFIFYFAVASAITPPVAIAAFAAASITKAEPMSTGFSAVRSGIVMFAIPFVFAIYPELLLIEPAVLDPTSQGTNKVYLPGYDGQMHLETLGWLLIRLILTLYLLASALARFDRCALPIWQWSLRLLLAVLVLAGDPMIHGGAMVVALALLGWHFTSNRQISSAAEPKAPPAGASVADQGTGA